MQTATATTFFIIAALLAFSGCGESSGRYPDQTPDTQAKADAIREEGSISRATVEEYLADEENALQFRANQNREKARQEREAAEIACDKVVQPLAARRQKALDEVAAEKISARENEKTLLKQNGADQAADIHAEAERHVCEADERTAGTVATLTAESDKAQTIARQEINRIQAGQTKALAEVDAKLVEARSRACERRLTVDAETSARLQSLETASNDHK